MGRKNKADAFRDGTYVRFVSFGKRTVKQGECAAVWSASGKRKVVEGPQRIRLWWSHVRFLSRSVAGTVPASDADLPTCLITR